MKLLHECKFKESEFTTGLQFFHDEERGKIKVITDKGREVEIDFDESISDERIVSPTDLLLEIKKVVNEPRMDVFILENCIKALEKIAKYDTYEYFFFTVNNDYHKDLFCVGEVYNRPTSIGQLFIAKTTVGDFYIRMVADLKSLKESVKKIAWSLSGGLTARQIYTVSEDDLAPFYMKYCKIFE